MMYYYGTGPGYVWPKLTELLAAAKIAKALKGEAPEEAMGVEEVAQRSERRRDSGEETATS